MLCRARPLSPDELAVAQEEDPRLLELKQAVQADGDYVTVPRHPTWRYDVDQLSGVLVVVRDDGEQRAVIPPALR